MKPGIYSLVLERGATFDTTFTLKADGVLVNLTGYTASLKITDAPNETGTAELTLTSGSGLTLGGVLGTVRVVITAAQTQALPMRQGSYRLDVITGSVVNPWLKGRVTVND